MGLKLLSKQMIPLRFHPTKRKTSSAQAVRLITWDGRVLAYERAVSVAELMHQHPCHLVCHSDAFVIGQKIPALSPDHRLQPGHSYLLLPAHLFQSVLSFLSLASSLAALTSHSNAKGSPLRHFDIQKTEKGTLQIRFSEESLMRIREDEEKEMVGRRGGVCTTEELEQDYKKLVRCSSKRWRPKLERIDESEKKRRFRLLNSRRTKRAQGSETMS